MKGLERHSINSYLQGGSSTTSDNLFSIMERIVSSVVLVPVFFLLSLSREKVLDDEVDRIHLMLQLLVTAVKVLVRPKRTMG